VAVGDRVYVTLGYGAPVTALDAATGQTVHTYRGTEGTSEIVCHGGVLFLVATEPGGEGAENTTARRNAGSPPARKRILAVRAATGELLWQKSDASDSPFMANTLACGKQRVYVQTAREVLCLDAGSGEPHWSAARPVAQKRPGFSAPTLVVYGDVVFSADRAAPDEVAKEPGRVHKTSWVDAPLGELIAFSAATGERLWSCPCRECFNAPVDVLVAGGLVWTGDLVVAAEPGITVGRDPATGEIKRRRPADQVFFNVGMPHLRCYRNKATNRYLVLGRAGVEFVDLTSGKAFPNHWIRGTCQHGVVPANGLLYVPPHSCACYTQAKLNGFYALAPESLGRRARLDVPEETRLEPGPAYGFRGQPPSADEGRGLGDWPTYRHDPSRSGRASCAVPTKLRLQWQADLGGRLTGVTVADGRLFVASRDDRVVCALNAETGEALWRYTAGGRVDGPPTIHRGRALFGSADGWVYCLRAVDGEPVWRFQAAFEDQRVVAYGQLESVWPVHGSVLVTDGVAQFAAGRSSYLDGGIWLYRVDAATGKMLSATCIDSRDPETGRQPKGTVEMFDLPGALPDVLSSDGQLVYMRHAPFDREAAPLEKGASHLFSPTGFLDDSGWHRSYWIFGTRFYTGYRDWFRAGREVPAGRPLVFDDSRVYGFALKPEYYYWSTPLEYHLFASSREPKIVPSPEKHTRVPEWGQRQIQYDWSKGAPLRARSMVLAGDALFVAGPRGVLDEERGYARADEAAARAELAKQADALAGHKGGLLLALSREDGSTLAEWPLDSPPVWDGMAVADGRLYLATVDGHVVCFAGR
jgi:outer membrane protein assembly factor BamB